MRHCASQYSLSVYNSSARKDRFVYGGAIFVDTSQPASGSRSTDRSFSLLFTNLDMNTTRYLHHEVDRRTPNATYAQPRWIPASLLLDANMCNASCYLFAVILRVGFQRTCVSRR